MTLSDVLEHHYGKPTRVVGAAACFIYSAPVLAMAGMMTLMEFLGFPAGWGLVVTIGVCAIYTTMGGLWADVAQRHDAVRADVRVAGDRDSVGGRLGRRLGVRRASAAACRDGGESLLHAASRRAERLDARRLVAHGADGADRAGVLSARVRGAGQAIACSGRCSIGILLWAAYDWGVDAHRHHRAGGRASKGCSPPISKGERRCSRCASRCCPSGLRGLMLGGILAAAMSHDRQLLAAGQRQHRVRHLPPAGRPERVRPPAARAHADRRVCSDDRRGVLISLLFERMRDTWQFMASVMAAVLLVPVMGALFGRPRRRRRFVGRGRGPGGLGRRSTRCFFSLGSYDDAERNATSGELAASSCGRTTRCSARCRFRWLGYLARQSIREAARHDGTRDLAQRDRPRARVRGDLRVVPAGLEADPAARRIRNDRKSLSTCRVLGTASSCTSIHA